MTAPPPSPTAAAVAAPGSLARAWPELMLAALLLAGLSVLPGVVLPNDVAWQLWIGRQLSHGVGLYSDIQEVNPPLWFWLSAAIAGTAELFGLAGRTMLIGFFVAVTTISAVLVAVLVREEQARTRAALYGTFAFAALGLTFADFGQREHFTLITAIPYVALIARRAEGRSVSPALALTVALFGAAGFALKPYFAAAPLLLELWLYSYAPKRWRFWRSEVIALALAAAGYIAATILLAPQFLTQILPMVSLAYGGYGASLDKLVATPIVILAVLSVGALALIGRGLPKLSGAFFVGAAAFFFAFLLQTKGWRYQALPATGLLLLALAPAAMELDFRRRPPRGKGGVFLAGVTAAVVIVATLANGHYRTPYRSMTEAALSNLPPGATVMVLSARGDVAWPMIEERRLVWPSRHMTFWMLPTIVESGHGLRAAELARLASRIRAQTVEDLTCNPPQRILIEDARYTPLFRKLGFDYLAFFQADPGFTRLFAGYRLGPRYGRISVYELAADRPPPRTANCRIVY